MSVKKRKEFRRRAGKRSFAVLVLVCMSVFSLSAADSLENLFSEIDKNYIDSRYGENQDILEDVESMVSTSKERAAYLWRLSRNILSRTDDLDREGADSELLLENYERGEKTADKAVSLDSNNHNAYYWRASNAGRWGQTKGVLNSLMKAGPMRDDLEKAVNIDSRHADSYYVLGQLYYSVPGFISFGNLEYAVSYGRRAIDVYEGEETKYNYYLKLAEYLEDRDWKSGKRKRKWRGFADEYKDADSPFEKNRYYEGVFDASASRVYSSGGVRGLSDEEEAEHIVSWIIDKLKYESGLTSGDKETLADAKDLYNTLQ